MHAVELFFIINATTGIAKLGADPELQGEQMLQELSFMDLDALRAIPVEQKHFLLRGLNTWDELLNRKVYSLDSRISI
jgi:hypothetical protein